MSDSHTQNDRLRSLAVQAQEGDRRAYSDLLREVAELSEKALLGRILRRQFIEDIVQEILISVHKSLNTYSPDKPFRPWLMAIIGYRRTDYLRRHYSSRSHLMRDTDSQSFINQYVTKPVHAGEYKDIEAALSQLSDKQRRIFLMTKLQGYSIEEVAQEMNMGESAVKVTAHRAQAKLKSILE